MLTGSLKSQVTRENTIKAVFLFNFTQFIEWPADAFASPSSPLVIGILGDDPFGAHIDETIQGEKAGSHPLIVQRFRERKDIKNCHILFINAKEADKEMLSSFSGKNVLTVSDAKNFMQAGGMIRFSTENNKIKLEINPEAAKAEGLAISSKLLRIATIFNPAHK